MWALAMWMFANESQKANSIVHGNQLSISGVYSFMKNRHEQEKQSKMNLLKEITELEISRLTYAKYLLRQAKNYLENKTVEHYFNISVILSANAAEVFLNVLAYCVGGQDRTKDTVSNILRDLNRIIPNFPDSEFYKIIDARNGVYHRVDLKTYRTCTEIVEMTERVFNRCFFEYLAVEYTQISMVGLVKDNRVREPLKSAERSLHDANYDLCVISSCEAFAYLRLRAIKRSRQQFKEENDPFFLFGTKISWEGLGYGTPNKITVGSNDIHSQLRAFSRHIEEQTNKKTLATIRLLDFALLVGDAYEDLKHFEAIAPLFYLSINDKFEYSEEDVAKKKFDLRKSEFIFDFVLRISLDLEAKFKPIEIRNLNDDVVRTIE
jgi:hypothetical protein